MKIGIVFGGTCKEYHMSEILITSETKNLSITVSTSETQIRPRLVQTVSDITTVGTEPDATIRAFQICFFINGTPIPNASCLELKKNVIAEVLYTNDGVIVRAGDVDEEGYGITLKEASIDFLSSINDRFNSLSRREVRLSQHELSILENIRKILN